MIREALTKIVLGDDLSQNEASEVMKEIMEGEVTPSQLGAFLTALRIKGETIDEISGLASTMREMSVTVDIDSPEELLDVVGTGGDSSGSFNISTAAAIVAAGAGQRSAKHGNRAASSSSGSADVLEALGVKIELGPDSVARCIREAGIGFMFAPLFHPAMRHAGPTRREIGFRTIFNILGPLTNPAGAGHQLVGVPELDLVETIANVLGQLGTEHSIVVHGDGGLDELSLSGPSLMVEYHKGHVRKTEITPQALGLNPASLDQIRIDSVDGSSKIISNVLNGELGPHRDIVVLNAGAALLAGDAVTNLQEGVQEAIKSIDSSSARDHLEKLVEVSNLE